MPALRPAPTASPIQTVSSREQPSIYLIRHGWHTGLALKCSDISIVDWPEASSFASNRFVEVGWGDESYLRSKFLNPFVMTKAALLPSRSALHVVGFDQPVQQFFPKSQIIELPTTPQAMRRLCRFIRDSYQRNDEGLPIGVGEAMYGTGGLYRASELYYVPKTCNVWTARALNAADCNVHSALCTFAPPLVYQSKWYGREIQRGNRLIPVIYPFTGFDRPEPTLQSRVATSQPQDANDSTAEVAADAGEPSMLW